MDDAPRSLASLPWSMDLNELLTEAATNRESAACLFTIESHIPADARKGYSALVIAYTRDGEPVTIFDDGAALLLVKSGGIDAARAAAGRVISQMHRLGLERTLRAGVVAIDNAPQTVVSRARDVVATAQPGAVAG